MSKQSLETVQALQATIIDVAARFVNVRKDNFPDVVQSALHKIGATIHANRVYLFEYNFSENTMNNNYEWVNEGVRSILHTLQNIPLTDYLDVMVQSHRENKSVTITDFESLPKASVIRRIYATEDIMAMVTMPLFINGECYGYFGFDINYSPEEAEILDAVRMLPQLFSSSLRQYQILEELEQAKDMAEVANNAKSNFLTQVTHELRTPLNGITNSLYLLEETELSQDQRQYTEIMRLSNETLSSLVDNILNYSRMESQHLKYNAKDVNLEQEMVKLLKVHKYIASNKEVGLYMEYDYSIPTMLSIDIEKVKQVLHNLLQNAIKFTNYGKVILKVEALSKKDPYIDIKFSVIDTGIGISSENQAHIFDEFYQVGDALTKATSGIGLGLTIANQITTFLKSDLTVESKERKGSTFSFNLTLYIPEETEQPNVPLHVLLVDTTQGGHSNIEEFLLSTLDIVDLCTLDTLEHYKEKQYDIIFIQTNDSRQYSLKLPEIKKDLSQFATAKKILLMDGVKSNIFADSFDLYDHHIELPESSKTILNYVRQDRNLANSIFRRSEELKGDDSSKSILLVDDNAINRKAMAKVLGTMDLEVTEARHGYEALEKVKEARFDIIFMDILMPGMDGYETTRRIREMDTIASAVPIIAVTANDVDSIRDEVFNSGMNGVLNKPLMKQDVHSLLNDYFATTKPVEVAPKTTSISVFDVAEFEALYEQPTTRKEIIEAFLDEQQQDMDRILEAFATQSTDYIYKELHYFKGSFAYLKANKIYRLTQTILDLCKQNMLDEAILLKESFLTNYYQLLNDLQEYINA